jgi:outer membrane murein-binding lipoprotein Lpp
MRFRTKTQVAAAVMSLAFLGGVTSGCASKPTQAQENMATRVEAAASKSEAAANKAEAAAKSAAEAAARAQAAANRAESMLEQHMRK